MTQSAPAAVVVHKLSGPQGPAAPCPSRRMRRQMISD